MGSVNNTVTPLLLYFLVPKTLKYRGVFYVKNMLAKLHNVKKWCIVIQRDTLLYIQYFREGLRVNVKKQSVPVREGT